MATIEGMGKDEPLEVNERGGKQSKLDHDFRAQSLRKADGLCLWFAPRDPTAQQGG